MAYFAKIGLNNKVIDVISVKDDVCLDADGNENEQIGKEFCESLTGWPLWVQCSYNTRDGIHYQPDSNTPSEDQSKAFRKNYAGVGYKYDESRDAFIAPKPYNSWTLNETSCLWEAPTPYPDDGNLYIWDEENLTWNLI